MTTINNSENLIEKVGGIEKAREIAFDPLHPQMTHVSNDGRHWVNEAFAHIPEIQCQIESMIRINDLRTAISEHDNTDIGTEIDSFLDAFKSPELTDDRKEELTQDWKGMSGGVAFSLIERHADNWKEIDYMMNQWLEANKEAERHE